MRSLLRFFGLLALLFVFVGCGGGAPANAPATPVEIDEPETLAVAAGGDQNATIMPEAGAIPVTADDPMRGDPLAPVTIVEFADFQCPFCQRASQTLAKLRTEYGPDQLRIVFKHNPLPFHALARPAADLSMALFRLEGPEAFWSFHDAAFAEGRLDERMVEKWSKGGDFTPDELSRALSDGARRKVDDDIALAKQLGANGTPAFFINGRKLSGAQPAEKFHELIDAELREARLAVQQGVTPERMYAHRTEVNLAKEPPPDSPPPSSKPPPDERTVHFVPVGDSPVRGKNTALVTLVMFSDFQCPYCGKVVPTIEELRRQYGDDLRVVFKHQPLPFHKQAEPAAQLAIEAFKKQGHPGFWKAHDALFAQQKSLDEASLASLAKTLGLNPTSAMAAVTSHKYSAVIEADQGLAEDVEAKGTPTFFVNGRRIVGAQPRDKFVAMIDEEIAKAKDMTKAGTPANKVYDAIMKTAVRPPPPKTVAIPAPTKANPSRGPKTAPVVIQVFSEFQCPFCNRAAPTIDELQKEFPNEVRVVFRHLPLPMHKSAPLAAAAAMEAFRQKGDAGFWKMHDQLFANQTDLSRTALEGHAATVGLDLAKFKSALESGTHDAAIKADMDIAEAAQITGTPAFVINGYFLSGAQPLAAFRKVVKRALDDKRTGVKPAATVAAP